MKKRTVLTLSIIAAAISIVFALSSYYGVDRYLLLHAKGVDGLIESYHGIPKAQEDKKTVIYLSARQEDFHKLRPTINSILDQTRRVDRITIVTPHGFKGHSTNPDFISKVANVQPAGRDYGDGTKLIPALLKEKDCDTAIIALDSGWVYGKDFIETMVDSISEDPKEVLMDSKGIALLVRPDCYDCDVIDRDKGKYHKEWFIRKAKGSKTIEYTENYKSF